MEKQSIYVSSDKQHSLYQQHPVFGRIHTRDYAFYMRKLAFMQQPQKSNTEKKEDSHQNNG